MIEKVAAQLYTLRGVMKTPAQIAEALKQVKAIGYRAVQVSGIGKIDDKELKKITDDLGLKICATHTPCERLVDDLPAVIERHKRWECDQIAVPSIPADLRNGQGFITFAKKMSEVGGRLCEEGITLSYHNHAFELETFDGKTGLDLIYDNSDPRHFQAEIDTYWIQYGGGDPAWWCARLRGRLPLVHLKDYGMVDNTPTFMEIGEGNLNWPAIFDACKKADTQWYPVEQDVCRRPPIESLKISFDNLKRMFAE